MTGEEQPLDISTNRPFKAFVQRQFNEWFAQLEPDERPSAGSLPVLKPLCVEWVRAAGEHVQANSDKMIVAGWSKAGLLAAFEEKTQVDAQSYVSSAAECEELPAVRDYLNLEQIRRMETVLAAQPGGAAASAAAAPPAPSPAPSSASLCDDDENGMLPCGAEPLSTNERDETTDDDVSAHSNDSDLGDDGANSDADDDSEWVCGWKAGDGPVDNDDNDDADTLATSLRVVRDSLTAEAAAPRRSTRCVRSSARTHEFEYGSP